MDMTPGIQSGLRISTWGQAPNRGKSLSAGWGLVTKNPPFSGSDGFQKASSVSGLEGGRDAEANLQRQEGCPKTCPVQWARLPSPAAHGILSQGCGFHEVPPLPIRNPSSFLSTSSSSRAPRTQFTHQTPSIFQVRMWALGLTSDQETQNLVRGFDGVEGIGNAGAENFKAGSWSTPHGKSDI